MADYTRLAVYMPTELKEQFRELAFDKRLSQSQLALAVLKDFVANSESKNQQTPVSV